MDTRFQTANISNTGIGHFISEFGMWVSDLIPQSAIRISDLGNYASRPFQTKDKLPPDFNNRPL